MKKQIVSLLILFDFLLVAVGCTLKPALSPSPDGNIGSATTPNTQGLNLPNNFSVMVDINAINPPAQVSRYLGNEIMANETALEKMLAERNPNGDYKINVMPKMLLIRDRNSKTYSRLINLARTIPQNGTHTYTPDGIIPADGMRADAQNGAMNNQDFRAWENIDNLPTLETSMRELQELFDAAGLKSITPVEAYALDAEVLKAHEIKALELQKQNQADEDGLEPYDWDTDDSCYLVIYTYNVDGIPLYYRENLHIDGRPVPLAYAYAFYGKNGLIGMEGYGLYEKVEEKATGAPLSAESMLESFLTELRDIIFEKGTKLTAFELCYLPVPTDGNTDLVPIWAFEVTLQGLERSIPDPYPRHIVFLYDAFSGEKYNVTSFIR